MIGWFSFGLPPHLALSDSPERGGGACTSCERKPQQGRRMLPLFPLCSLQLIDAGSLLPFIFTGTVQGSAPSLGAAPISGLLLGAESSSAETGDIYTLPLPNKMTQSRKGERPLWSEAETLKETDNMATGGSHILICLSAPMSGFSPHFG